jgi:hypothetical protein
MIGLSALKNARKTIVDVATFTGNTIQTAKDLGQSAVDMVTDTKDRIVGAAEVAYKSATMLASMLTSVGIVVAAIAAPIPTAIGIILFELLTIYAYEAARGVDERQKEKQARRTTSRLIEKLAKYGAIPATALIETSLVSLRLDSRAGTATGKIKTGFFSSHAIETLTIDELDSFISTADVETAEVLKAYRKFRTATQV